MSDTDFLDIVNDYVIVIFTETWISPNTHYNLDIRGFISNHIHGMKSIHARKGRYIGGVSVYFRSCLSDKIKTIEKNHCGVMWIKLCKSPFHFNTDVFLCSAYVKPHDSKVLSSDDVDVFEQIELGIEKYKLQGKVFF